MPWFPQGWPRSLAPGLLPHVLHRAGLAPGLLPHVLHRASLAPSLLPMCYTGLASHPGSSPMCYTGLQFTADFNYLIVLVCKLTHGATHLTVCMQSL